jgi:hypothetical protein
MLFQLRGLSNHGPASTIKACGTGDHVESETVHHKRGEHMLRTQAERLDAALDAALAMTFPASDPIALYVADEPQSAVADDERPSAGNAN